MDVDMDVDMDIDIQLDGDDLMEPEQPALPYYANEPSAPPVADVSLPTDTIAVGTDDILPILDKIHIRGVDHLSSADLKQFAGEHYPLDEFERIEWIDDTSANFIYSTVSAASEALIALTNSEFAPADASLQVHQPLQLRPAKPFSMKPEAQLYVRQATSTDVKQKGAHESSRYYLLNPDQDPRERRKQQQDGRRPRGGDRRRANGNGEYTRVRYDDNEHNKRRRDDAHNGFTADLYDDDAGDESSGPRTDYERRKRLRTRRSRDELLPRKTGMAGAGGRLRGRSASPLDADGDGRLGFSDDLIGSRARLDHRHRSRSPQQRRDTARKELFPSLTTSSNNTSGRLASTSTPQSTDLFPHLAPAAPATDTLHSLERTPPLHSQRSSLELFPSKRSSFSHHRRSAAMDSTPGRERSLAERIGAAGPPLSSSSRSATAPRGAYDDDGTGNGIRVRGAAGAENGISIRGAASQQQGAGGPSVRELFPLKAGGNAGKELFGEKIKGRGGPRRKAEDMFS